MHAVRVTVICDGCVRIEYAPGGLFCDHPSLFAIHGPAGDAARVPEMGLASRVFTTSADAGSPAIEVRTKRMAFAYVPDGRRPHAGNMRALVEHPSPPEGLVVGDGRVVWTPGAQNKFNLGGTLSTLDGLRGAWPLGDGLLARDGWHLVDDSSRHLLIDGWAATRESAGLGGGGNTDWYLFAYGDDYASVLRAMTIIAGRVPMPRRCLLGSWYSRYWPYTSDEYRGIVDEFEVHGFPLDVLVLDMDWHKPGWTGWSWNRELLPDAEELMHWLHARGLAVTLNLHPADGVGPQEDRYKEFMRALTPPREADGKTVPFDAGDRAYMRALFEAVHRPLEAGGGGGIGGEPGTGVDFWWVDWQQDKFVRSIPGLTNLRWLNHLYFEHTSGRSLGGGDDSKTRRGASGYPSENRHGVAGYPRRGVSFSRWAADEPNPDPDAGTEWGHPTTGGWGDHRHPIHFSGDAHTGWKMLEFQVPFTATAGNIGCFFWSHDIGGHFGARLEEAMARWVQFGALSAALRVHSARTGSLDRRPWTYEERFCESMRRAYGLRSRLMPYVYSSVRACYERAMPLLRPMYLCAPRDERAYRVPGQYMLGEDLLVAPIVSAGVGERCVGTRHVWFPPPHMASSGGSSSSSWHDLVTGERHEAGAEAIVAADIDRVPLFVRAGVLLAMRPLTHRMTTEPLETLVLSCFAGSDGAVCERELYEDDGISLGYEREERAITPLRAAWTHGERDGTATVTLEAVIGPTRGSYAGQPVRRAVEVRVGAVHRVVEAQGARESEYVADEAGGTVVLRVGETDIREAVRVRVVFEAADPRLIAYHLRLKSFAAATGETMDRLGGVHLREHLIAGCRDDERCDGDGSLRQRLLEIGAGIGAVVDQDSVRLIDTLGWIENASVEAEIVDRLGAVETPVERRTVALETAGGHSRACAVEIPGVQIALPRIGLRSSRVARFRFAVHGAPMAVEAVAATSLAPLTEFLVVGPFVWDWRKAIGETVYGPEGGGGGGVRADAVFEGRDGARVAWRKAAKGAKWEVDLRASLGTRGGLAYAATSIVSMRRQEVVFHFECGDKLQAFLNGEKIITLDDHSEHAATEPMVRAKLREGRNELLIKTSDGGGGWGFVVCIEGAEELVHVAPGSM